MNKKNELKVCKEYQAGAKQVELAFKYDVPKDKIREILVKNKIPIRTGKPPIKFIAIVLIVIALLWLVLQWISTL